MKPESNHLNQVLNGGKRILKIIDKTRFRNHLREIRGHLDVTLDVMKRGTRQSRQMQKDTILDERHLRRHKLRTGP